MNIAQAYDLTDAVDKGVWRTLPKGGFKVKVASLRSPAYKTAIVRLSKEYASEMRTNDEAVVNMITCKAMAECILLDWEDLLDEDDKPVPYSQETAEMYLRKYEIMREEVAEVSVRDENYLVGEIVEKSRPTSTGTKSMGKTKAGTKDSPKKE